MSRHAWSNVQNQKQRPHKVIQTRKIQGNFSKYVWIKKIKDIVYHSELLNHHPYHSNSRQRSSGLCRHRQKEKLFIRCHRNSSMIVLKSQVVGTMSSNPMTDYVTMFSHLMADYVTISSHLMDDYITMSCHPMADYATMSSHPMADYFTMSSQPMDDYVTMSIQPRTDYVTISMITKPVLLHILVV